MSTLKADTIQSTSGGAATLTKQSAAKARATVRGLDTFQIHESFGVSSASDEGTGHHNIALTSAMSSISYQPQIAAGYADGNPGNTISTCWSETSTNVEFETSSAAGANQDITKDYLVVFGDLA